MNTQQKFFYIGIASIILIIITLVLTLRTTQKQTPPSEKVPIPTPFVGEGVKPVIKYQEGSLKKSVEKIKNPGKLSAADQKIRLALIERVGNKSGVIFSHSTFRITYMQTFNFFESEILTTNIQQAKSDTIAWLKQQGLSTDGVCHLPLTFFLNSEVANNIKNPTATFNPNPEGC